VVSPSHPRKLGRAGDVTSATLSSVNVGRAQTVPGGRRYVRSAIWKTPVEGRVAVRGVNLDGDEQADRRVHGGPDKAVYAYGTDDLRRWESELGRELGPGAFGENLTIEALDVSGARPGDRWAIGSTLLEVVQPRVPCFKLASGWATRGSSSGSRRRGGPARTCASCEEGELGAGDAVEVVHRADHEISVRFMMHALLVDHAMLPEVLRSRDSSTSGVPWRCSACPTTTRLDRQGRAHHDGPLAARAVRLPEPRGDREGVAARRARSAGAT
jgi:MOSC domain-containing protein YiiM